jgi:hypothetical protein
MDQQLRGYIESCLALSIPGDQIRQGLLNAGWSTSDIDRALSQLVTPARQEAASPQDNDQAIDEALPVGDGRKYSFVRIGIAIVALLLLLVIGAAAVNGFDRTGHSSATSTPIGSSTTSSRSNSELTANNGVISTPIGSRTTSSRSTSELASNNSVTSTTTWGGATTSQGNSISLSGDAIKKESCGTAGCFDEEFRSCSPATLDEDIGIASVQYQIYGPKSTGCNVRFRYTGNPNPNWVNKDLTCVFNNKLSIDHAIEDVFKNLSNPGYACQGPLVPVLHQAGL